MGRVWLTGSHVECPVKVTDRRFRITSPERLVSHYGAFIERGTSRNSRLEYPTERQNYENRHDARRCMA
jgi:hypothetical protein